ncbi:MAG: 60S ribosomal protein L31 [Nanoarchaeota archaeon]|nr:60S ribosomal protein L31 [Nanoarchaeota archaeon]
MAIERTYIVPLRRELLKVPIYKRAKKAVAGLKAFLKRHMKSDDIRIGEQLNKELWKNGMKNPPQKVKITVIKEDDGMVKAELFGYKYVVKKKAEKVEEPKGIAGKLQKAIGGSKKEEVEAEVTEKTKDDKPEPKKEAKKPEAKPVKKEEKTDKPKSENKPKPAAKKE